MINGPIVIGGVGGSGTRVVVSILKVFNVFLGHDLNSSLDNVTYTLLFKQPKWFYKNNINENMLNVGFSVMEKSMTNTKKYSPKEFAYLVNATKSMAIHGHNVQKEGAGRWAINRFKHIILNRNKDISSYPYWGWKEPNSHLLIKELNGYFKDFKFIHTIRHGLDMAYSPNQQQFYNWAKLFGVSIPENEADIPAASFSYWAIANRRVVELQKELGKDKIYLLNFDELCVEPETEIIKLAKFLNIDINDNQLKQATNIPKIPKTSGRFREFNISEFRKEDLDFLYSMGYSV